MFYYVQLHKEANAKAVCTEKLKLSPQALSSAGDREENK